jgi:hypothetical protein
MAIRRVPDASGRENFRIEPVPGLRMTTVRRDPVEPVPVGTYVALVFRVTGYDQDCDGSLMARLERVDAGGRETGWKESAIGLYPDCAWVVDGPGELDG